MHKINTLSYTYVAFGLSNISEAGTLCAFMKARIQYLKIPEDIDKSVILKFKMVQAFFLIENFPFHLIQVMTDKKAARKRLLQYILPVLFLSFAFNIPKFFEAKIVYHPTTDMATRQQPFNSTLLASENASFTSTSANAAAPEDENTMQLLTTTVAATTQEVRLLKFEKWTREIEIDDV